MTLTRERRHIERKNVSRHGARPFIEFLEDEWPQPLSPEYDFEDELCAQLHEFPSPEQVEELCSVLRVATLRDLSVEIVVGGIEHVKNNTGRLNFAKFLNSWIATAEETLAAGSNVSRIAARRTKKS